jgi:hypothetical protein
MSPSRWPVAHCLAASLAAFLVLSPANTGRATDAGNERSVAIETIPVTFSSFDTARTRFGRLEWRGGFEITSPDDRFGGLSGLVLAEDGRRMVAVSDLGWWFEARLGYVGGMLAAMTDARMGRLLDTSGRPFRGKAFRDAEAVATDDRGLDGDLLVGFERETRILRYPFGRDGMAARPRTIPIPPELAAGPDNKELEAVGRFAAAGPMKGAAIAISERHLDGDGNILGWILGGTGNRRIALKRIRDFDITDLAIDARTQALFTLERRFSPFNGAGMLIRRFAVEDLAGSAPLDGEVLLEANQTLTIDNMEGLALTRAPDGELRLTVVSDDNYNGFQRTLLMQFALTTADD